MSRCLWSLGALAKLMVWDREGCLHAGGGRPNDAYAGFCGQLMLDWYFCEAADPQAKGAVERLQGYLETNFERGRRFDFQLQLDGWFPEGQRAGAQNAQGPADRPSHRRARGDAPAARVTARLRPPLGDTGSAGPYLRVDTNDYSLDPKLAGRRAEVRVSQLEVSASALDTGELACRHERSFAKHRTITALEHARTLRERRGQPEPEPELLVQQRPLSVYDQLIA